MEVLNPRVALLSNYEVLTLLHELESDHLARAKTALRVKKEEEAAGIQPRPAGMEANFGEPSENLRTVEIEAIQYLSADFLPTSRHSPERITKLVKDLAPYELTKAEKLQIVNLAPTLPVELYVIVEELEDRLGDRMEEILSHVDLSLGEAAPAPVLNPGGESSMNESFQVGYPEPSDEVYDEEIVFDDTGEGVGIEGDLDMEED
ncbi:hypothetical protein H0H92_000886 [Tricholoma furcatifolium]|nr:hypothetical protein H0H92_000886 [Tricholoma furcatifolium]